MKEKLRKFLRPRLAVLLAAALLAASLPAGVLPSAYAVDIELKPAPTWEDAVSGEFTAAGTALDSYTCYGSDGSEETVTVDHEAEPGSRENPISIPDEESLIRFGKLESTEGKYYILDKENGVYDMQGDTRSMLPLMGACESDGTSGMPSPERWFAGVLIGNGAEIQNACIKAPAGNRTHPGLFGCLKNAEIMDLTVSLTFAEQNNSSCYAGGIAAAASGHSSLRHLTVDLTVAENSVYKSAGGLVGGIGSDSTMTMAGCSANVTGKLEGSSAGGLVGSIGSDSTVTMTGCTATVTGDLDGRSAAGGLVGKTKGGTNVTMTDCSANVTGDLDGWSAGGLVGEVTNGSTVTMTDCSATVTGNLNGGCIGGLAGGAYRVVADGCNATVKGNLTATDTYCAAGGLVGASCCVILTGCNAEITGSLTAEGDTDTAGGLVGKIEAIEEEATVLDHCTVRIGGSLQGGAAGGLVGDGSNMTLTDCNTTVTGSLTAGRYGISGGLVGGGDNMTLTGCTADVTGDLTAGRGGGVGGLVGSGSDMTLTGCTAEVGGSLTTGDGISGGLVGYAFDSSSVPTSALQEEDDAGDSARSGSAAMSLTNCSVKVGGGLTAGEGGASGGLVGLADSGAVTLTDCSVQTVITERSPSGPVGMGDECVTFTGANVTTLQMGADSHVSLALVNGTALELTDTDGLTATGEAANSDNSVTGSVTVGGNGNAEINVHGGANSGGATYTLTGVNGTIRLEDKTPAEYRVTLDAGFNSTDPDPLARGDAVDLLGAADNRTHTVTVEAGTGGTVSGGGTVARNQQTTVTATPDSGYRFAGWTENGQQVSTEASYTFTVTSSRTLTAVFERGSTGGSSGGGYTPPKKDEPQTGSSGGWKDIQKELEGLEPGDEVDVTMNGATEVPKEVLEGIAGKDVNVNFDMGGGIVWTVNGKDIPSGIGSLNLGIRTGSSSIPVNVFNTITGEKSTMQFTLAHSGPFGTVLHLSLNLGTANRGYWANLYWFDESSKELVFQHSCRIDSEGKASWPFDHASSYAVVIDEKNHDPAWENPFADVSEGNWYYEAVRFVQERGLMNGYSDGRFGPNDTLSRAQLAQILFNKEGRPEVNYLLTFSDVAGEAWYTEAIRWATSQGIVGGYGNGMFGPNDPITREQLVVMLWRYVGSPAAANKELHFNDTDEISGFALEAMRWAVENGILNGYGDGRLGPQGQATRAQVAQMLKNFIENQGDNS